MEDPQADTTVIDDKFLRTVSIHGREFQKYSIDHSIHFAPVDEEEADRLLNQHRVLDIVFDGRLIFPPLERVKNVLDCGYGSASWAVEVAENYPDCTVVGVDISPHMKPDDMPENFWPQLDDLNQTFTFKSNTFDLVHSRLVGSGINKARWPSYIRDIVRVLKPGGWVQMIECYYMCQSDNGSITDNSALRQWSSKYFQALGTIKDLRAPLQLHNMLSAAGLVNIENRMIPLPFCGWPNNAREKNIGEENKVNVQQILSTFALYPFTQRLGMSIEEFENLINRARVEATNPSLKCYFPLYVCIAKKPV